MEAPSIYFCCKLITSSKTETFSSSFSSRFPTLQINLTCSGNNLKGKLQKGTVTDEGKGLVEVNSPRQLRVYYRRKKAGGEKTSQLVTDKGNPEINLLEKINSGC